MSISVIMEEQVKMAQRALKSHFKSYSGPSFVIEDLAYPRDVNSLIVLSQTKFSQKDVENPCRNYPFGTFARYGECDNIFVRSEVRKMTGGLIPFWASRTLDEISKIRFAMNLLSITRISLRSPLRRVKDYPRFEVNDFYEGTKASRCYNPCLSTQIKASLIKDRSTPDVDDSWIYMTFDQTVDISEYYYPEFSVSDFLSSLGGSLGLWLGIGMAQIGAYLNIVLAKIRSFTW